MFGDVVPIPIPVLRDVISIGDVLLWVGIVWAIFAAMTRRAAATRSSVALGASPARPMPAGEFQLGVAYATAMPLAAELAPELPGPGIGVALEEEEERPVAVPAAGHQPQLRPAVERPARQPDGRPAPPGCPRLPGRDPGHAAGRGA